MTVYLVGAGPGDPGLLTVRGAELLARADVVIHDRLSAASLLELAPEGAEIINVGKRPPGDGRPARGASQDEINLLLIEHGRQRRCVVRLKGGDPFVFARGGEEAAALEAAGVLYEVVPGISSAIAVPAYAGIPVTLRYSATSFTVVTGHEDPAKALTSVDWEQLARGGGTLIILMGIAQLPEITRRLLAGGLAESTPVAVIRWGTRSAQQTDRGTLATICDHDLRAPSVIVVGDVAAEHLRWFERRPLLGRTVVVTRARHQAGPMSALLREAGAEVIPFPVIELAEPADGGARLRAVAERVEQYEWVVFTSPNGASRFLDAVGDGRRLAGVRIAAIGPGTSAEVERRFLGVDLMPESFVAEALLDAMPAPPTSNATPARVLLARAEVARDVLPDGLRAAGWDVEILDVYRTVATRPDAALIDAVAAADLVTFTSSSTVERFIEIVGLDRVPAAVASIGPITTATAVGAGLHVDVDSPIHSIPGLLDAIIAWARP